MNFERQRQRMEGYYRWQAPIYDLTRWAFLFGRKPIIDKAKIYLPNPRTILEVGCGTGFNLKYLASQFPNASIFGIDISESMIRRASRSCRDCKNVQVIQGDYSNPLNNDPFDLILFSYSMTMVNPGYEQLLENAASDVSDIGLVAIVDFHQTQYTWFRRWMDRNHVKMDGQVLSSLNSGEFILIDSSIRPAYDGLWSYMTTLARKRVIRP